MVANILPADYHLPLIPTQTLGVRSKGQYSTFSEHGHVAYLIKETKSATMNIFRIFLYFLFKSFVKAELSYVFTINLVTIAENCTEK